MPRTGTRNRKRVDAKCDDLRCMRSLRLGDERLDDREIVSQAWGSALPRIRNVEFGVIALKLPV
jgi:hypothetical protein